MSRLCLLFLKVDSQRKNWDWNLLTSLQTFFNVSLQPRKELSALVSHQAANFAGLYSVINRDNGLAPNLLPDADDTAKTVMCLNMLGRPVSPAAMIATFQCDNHFKTYVSERTSSLSANCNVLNALLHAASPGTYSKEILKAAQFLCDSWYNGPVKDKWVRPNHALISKQLFC